MNKKLGFVIILFGILLVILLFLFKAREDYYISLYVKQEETCFLEDGTCLHEDRNFLVYIFGSVLSVLLIFLGLFLIFSYEIKRKNKYNGINNENINDEKNQKNLVKENNKLLDKSNLLPDEKIVFEKIVESNGAIFQSELVEKTNYSKVKITRILDKLEGRGLIERKRRGMTNVVVLKN